MQCMRILSYFRVLKIWQPPHLLSTIYSTGKGLKKSRCSELIVVLYDTDSECLTV